VKCLIILVGGGCQPQKFDQFELAGFNLTEEQKKACIELGITMEQLRALIGSPEEKLAEKCKKLIEEFKPLQFQNEMKNKTKNWNRKRFYD